MKKQEPPTPLSSTPSAASQTKSVLVNATLPGRPSGNLHTHFNIPEEAASPPRPTNTTRISGSAPARPSTSILLPGAGGIGEGEGPDGGPSGRQSGEEERVKKRSRYSEIFSGPKNVRSLFKKANFHLTWKIDNSYFSGKAGSLRIVTLLFSVITFGTSLPGYSDTPQLYVGYGASPLIPLSMALFTVCILINTVMVILLLCFREVRCQSKWDDWNRKAFASASAIAAVAGIIELGGIFHVRRMNCDANPSFSCKNLYRNSIHKPTKPELNMSYKDWHYFSVCGKLVCAISYSFCSRIFLKNNDRLHSNLRIKQKRIDK